MTTTPETTMNENFEAALPAMLKEYEALRKEVELRTDATKTYGWPVIALGFGAAAGLAKNVDLAIVLALIPLIGITIAALTANANYTVDRTRESLANVEERINRLAERPLMLEETERVRQRPGNPVGWMLFSVAVAGAYVYLEAGLLGRLTVHKMNDDSWELWLVVAAIFGTPLWLYLYHSYRRFVLQRSWAKYRTGSGRDERFTGGGTASEAGPVASGAP